MFCQRYIHQSKREEFLCDRVLFRDNEKNDITDPRKSLFLVLHVYSFCLLILLRLDLFKKINELRTLRHFCFIYSFICF